MSRRSPAGPGTNACPDPTHKGKAPCRLSPQGAFLSLGTAEDAEAEEDDEQGRKNGPHDVDRFTRVALPQAVGNNQSEQNQERRAKAPGDNPPDKFRQ